ncbi:MAG: alpha/beta hydrolase [Anaerolineae bacterium]|nr:alpha/beta hydrolase [Anaerolineae bacterium]
MALSIDSTTFVLIHSPFLGAFTWSLVADQLRQRGYRVIVPSLSDHDDSDLPYWQQHADSVRRALTDLPADQPLTLVAHSGAGPRLPAIRAALDQPVTAYVFVDAGIPVDGTSWLDLMRVELPDVAAELHALLIAGERFPTWTSTDLAAEIPDPDTRDRMLAELHPRPLAYFEELLPVFDSFPDAPCHYLQLSAGYALWADRAAALGWTVQRIAGNHFHLLNDPKSVTDGILAL